MTFDCRIRCKECRLFHWGKSRWLIWWSHCLLYLQ